MKWPRLFRETPVEEAARRLYVSAVAQARQAEFYERLDVPDTPDGRFDMIVVHVVLVMWRMRHDHIETAPTAQALFDIMFADMDQNLREMGIGDIGVGKRVKAMARGFYGRLAAYDGALTDGDGGALAAALERNLYRRCEPRQEALATMVRYVRGQAAHLQGQSAAALIGGDVDFAPPAAFEEEDAG